MKLLIICTMLFASAQSLACPENEKQIVEVSITDKGFEPSTITVNPDHAVKLKVTRKTDSTCATAIQIPDKKIKKDLPLNKTVVLELGHLKKGEMKFGCGMNMMESGKIVIR